MIKVSYLFLILFLVALFMGCKKKIPDTVLPESKMEEILYDYHLAKYMAEQLPNKEKYKKKYYMEDVFRKNNISEAEFDSSLVWYSRNTDYMVDVYEGIEKRLDGEIRILEDMLALHDRKLLRMQSGDSVNIWNGQKLYLLSSVNDNALFSFSQDVDSTFHKGDTVRLNVTLMFNGKTDACRDCLVDFNMLYRDNMRQNSTHVLSADSVLDIILVADSTKILRSLGFSIYLNSLDKIGRDKLAVKDLGIYRCR